MDGKGFRKVFENIFRETCGQRGAEINIFDAEIKQSQQDGDRLLFIPGKDEAQRQIIDVASEGFGQSDGDDNGAAGVVALPHIHEAGNSRHRTEIEIVETIFSAGQCQNKRIGRCRLDKIRKVTAAFANAVTAADEEDVI